MTQLLKGPLHLARQGVSTLATAMLLSVTVTATGAETLRTGGTGAAAGMLKILGEKFAAENPGFTLEIMPSLGSTGAIAAVKDNALDFAVSSRDLKPEEAAASMTASHFATSPFGLATLNRNPGDLAKTDVAAFFSGMASKWPNGVPVRVILRPRSESDSSLLAGSFPGMGAAIEALRQRPEVAVAATDQDNLRMAERVAGSLAAASLTQVQLENPQFVFVAIDGVTPSLENLENGSYPYTKKFYLVRSVRPSPVLDRFVAFLGSPSGTRVLRQTGSLAASHD